MSGADGLDDPEVALVASLERLLLQPAPRRDPEVLERLLAPDLVLLELVTDHAGRWARRHSLWRRRPDGQWQTFLHQGTLTSPDPEG